ncbi:DUF4225 domain-containing protein [Citrobacter sp. FP75]|uniref:DUF4225 domain-containing protein n=1 Tax=Citrobacter sp. FP75 TaxID=1852949 RepID=UPI001BC925CF|nr:DUF4225 domain-containing protein [Citrobacter sp. FP75]
MQKNQKDIDNFLATSRELRNSAQQLSYNYIYYPEIRRGFLNEEEAFIRHIEKEISLNCLSYAGGSMLIKEEIENLAKQKFALDANAARLYIIAEKEKERNSFTTITLKRVGFVSGGLQIYGGGSICVATLGLACASYGFPLMAHGMNNMYENGYYLLFQEDTTGYTKDTYRYIANKFNYSNDDADVVYNLMDLGLSGYTLGRQVVKPDAWKLYRYISSDYTRGWKLMGNAELGAELIGDASTVLSIYSIKKEY